MLNGNKYIESIKLFSNKVLEINFINSGAYHTKSLRFLQSFWTQKPGKMQKSSTTLSQKLLASILLHFLT
jgi:hypothetical protein